MVGHALSGPVDSSCKLFQAGQGRASQGELTFAMPRLDLTGCGPDLAITGPGLDLDPIGVKRSGPEPGWTGIYDS